MIDEDLKAWILEINNNPSLNIYFDPETMSTKRKDENDICQVDLYVKSRLVTDTILLAKKNYKSIKETQKFRGLYRIHPNDEAEEGIEVYDIV